jgi:adenylate cyclase
VAGLSIPTLLIGHAVSTRVALELYGHPTDYAHVVWMLWHSGREGRQIALLVPGWLHGCLGLNFVLSSRSWFPRYRLALFAAALLLPVLAVLGFFSMLKEVSVLAQSASWVATTIRPMNDARHQGLDVVHNRLLILYGSAIVAVFAARLLRTFIEERRGTLVSIAFPHRTVRVPLGWSVLEASRAHHIDHVSMCGGQARCSTCRVRVTAGEDHCPPPLENERRTLTRVRVPQGIRLACQLRPQADVAVVPLVSPATQVPADAAVHAEEQQVAIALVKFWWDAPPIGLLPHDLLHALDRFNRTTGDTLRASGGTPVEFSDNQVLVLFGLDVAATEAAQGALLAAARLNERLNALGHALHRELGCSAHHVIHLHYGVAVVGETGDQLMRTRTAMGGAVEVIR